MARTVPVHAGYTILNGVGTGSNGNRIDVWVEYQLGQQNIAENYTPIMAYFYAALNPSYTSSTSYNTGLNSTFSVNGVSGTGVEDGAYDFTTPDTVNLLGTYNCNIPHEADGSGEVTFAGEFTTLSSYISGGSISATVSLPEILPASAVSASDVVLGQRCCVQWTPTSAEYSFMLVFSLGSWSQATTRIYPKTNGLFTYTGMVLPLHVANRFAEKSAPMTVRLITYRDQEMLGSYWSEFTVTVPENEKTCPVVTATLSPECAVFPGVYVQRLGKIRADATATDPFGARITQWNIYVDGIATEGTVSDYLEKSGVLTVTVEAVSSRGFAGRWTGEISVFPYDRPRLTATVCRCLEDGTADPRGRYLSVDAQYLYSPVAGSNAVVLQWRYKPSGGDYSSWQPLSTGAQVLLGAVLEREKAYTVQLRATDTPGSVTELTRSVPAEQVYMHRTADAMGLGGYAGEKNTLTIHWDVAAQKGINGAYIRSLTTTQNSFSVHLCGQEQTVFVLGAGVQGIVSNGHWQGTAGVSVASGDGVVTVTLPADGSVLLLSPEPMEI